MVGLKTLFGEDYGDALPNELYNNLFVTNQAEYPEAAFGVLAYLMLVGYQRWSVSISGSTTSWRWWYKLSPKNDGWRSTDYDWRALGTRIAIN